MGMFTASGKETNGSIRRFAKLLDFVDSVNNLTVLVAVRRGLALTIPLMIIGSLAIFINNIPIAAFQNAMLSAFGEGWVNFGNYVNQATMGIMSITVSFAIGYTLAENKKNMPQEIHPMMGALVSISSLFVLMRLDGTIVDWLGQRGLFVAVVTAFLATQLYLFLCGIKWMRIKLYSNAAETHFTAAVSSLLPAVLTLMCVAAFRVIMELSGVEDIHEIIYDMLGRLSSGMFSPLINGIIYVFLMHGLWFFGIHGNSVLQPLARSILNPAADTNAALIAAGLPATEILNSRFLNTFVYLGGAGATLCLIIALLIGIKRSNTRRVAGISILPGLINVNEVMVFGVPVVLNLYLLIPFITLPIILTLTSYAATAMGLVPIAVSTTSWTTPIFFSGYAVTGSIAGALLQLFNLVIGTLVYLPFVRLYENSMNRDNKRSLSRLMDATLNLSELQQTVILNRSDSSGNMARALASDMPAAMQSGEISLHYQPLVSADGTVFSVESLLRWNHRHLGYIPPPVAVVIAEEAGLIHKLGMWIFDTALKALKGFRDSGADIDISINITPSQLDNPSFAKDVMELVNRYGLKPEMIDIEITEQTALGGLERLNTIQELKKMGLHVAIDDFGMGHGSLTYLKDLNLDVIKIDGSLVKEIETNSSCRDIISTITGLGRSMNIRIIAEYVENEKQRDLLKNMGCTCYQGYLYSPALPFDKATSYILDLNKKPVEIKR